MLYEVSNNVGKESKDYKEVQSPSFGYYTLDSKKKEDNKSQLQRRNKDKVMLGGNSNTPSKFLMTDNNGKEKDEKI